MHRIDFNESDISF